MIDSSRHFVIAMAFMAALTACGAPSAETQHAPQAAAEKCRIDADARLPWSEWRLEDDAQGTAIFEYSGCGKRLVFVATEHSNDPEGQAFQAVLAAFETPPDIVLFEGFPSSRGENPSALLDHAKSLAGTPGDNEAMLTVRQADAAAIPFIGAEPDDPDVLRYVTENGLSTDNLVGYYVLRQLPQMIMAGEVDGATDPRLVDTVEMLVPYFATEVGLDPTDLSHMDAFAEFKSWYSAFNGVPFESGFRIEDSHPSAAIADARASNRASDIVADARDAHILTRIDDALTRHDNVLIVYGGSHHTVQTAALSAALGAPERIR